LITGSVFAQSKSNSKSETPPKPFFSFGAGGYFTSDFGGGIQFSSSSKTEMPYAGGGAFAFFDATYAELSVGMFAANGEFDEKRSAFGMDFGLLGKFPIQLSKSFSFFPLLGIEYHLVLSALDKDEYQFQNKNKKAPFDLSAFWFKAGAGLDFSFSEALYVRGELLYGLRLANKYEVDTVKAINKAGYDGTSLLGHGLNIKLALGYRLY
jgi:hypothetical protein